MNNKKTVTLSIDEKVYEEKKRARIEAEKKYVGKGGVIRDSQVHKMVLTNMTTWAVEHNWNVHDIIPSPITGSAGNQEFLLHLTNGQVM